LNGATDDHETDRAMSTIINARFQQQAEADRAVLALNAAGFESRYIATFFVSSAGQHAMHPLGGDEEASPGTENSPTTAAAGAAVGGVAGAIAGVATLPLLGPAAAAAAVGVGAWVGSLYGALGGTDAKDAATSGGTNDAETELPIAANTDANVRKSGMLVAVAIRGSAQEAEAITLLQQCGGMDIERCTGIISQGEWRDFNPLDAIHPVAIA
jgi:hypothetical protein